MDRDLRSVVCAGAPYLFVVDGTWIVGSFL
jgi:hypothetical protein